MAYTQLLVNPPAAASNPDGAEIFALAGKQGDGLVSNLHGKHFTANYRGRLFGASAAAVTIPVNAGSLASVFALYNPPASGVNMELVEASITNVLVATVIDAVGWYYSTAVLTAAATFTTKGTVQSMMVGNSPANQGLFYSSLAHSGTPVLLDIIGCYGATTDQVAITKFYDGRLIIPPGVVASIAMSTTVSTGSGVTLSAVWQESPV
jgi:hypothetical protein